MVELDDPSEIGDKQIKEDLQSIKSISEVIKKETKTGRMSFVSKGSRGSQKSLELKMEPRP